MFVRRILALSLRRFGPISTRFLPLSSGNGHTTLIAPVLVQFATTAHSSQTCSGVSLKVKETKSFCVQVPPPLISEAGNRPTNEHLQCGIPPYIHIKKHVTECRDQT
ncbi:hypothetical protein Zmor_000637 [Zophobas morio]|uniref:Uncharacterized protein n=1 Tax=Zophobas morio TaxID=2755281 RepID=A0AA38MRL6_9CUCU|nr:hypothetical protein Zmor_000637 [Zophobas morio]